jgi:polyribonucleotide nucleotidyltransferase
LAERAIEPVIPKDELFPYTIRIVADILESNGSSSMATVCGGSLALMDAGVPIKTAVAGIAMGLVKGDKKSVVLTDISGIEDHLGDMDFKVSGTRKGITAFQMDVKVEGIGLEILKQALEQARVARLEVLNTMDKIISAPRPELSVYAPRITSIQIKPEKIGEVIGTGGKIIRAIIEQSGAKIDIEDDGMIYIAATNPESAEKAKQMIMKILEEPEMGKIYMGKVKKVTTFGAFVEIIPGQEGLVHISELDFKRVHKVEDVVNVGDEIQVKVIGIEPDGKIRLSRKATLSNAYSKG